MAERIKGIGLSYGSRHHKDLVLASSKQASPSWLEILYDNFTEDGLALKNLEEISSLYPLVFHCVGMNLASNTPLDINYLNKLKSMIDIFKPEWVSDHLCWTAAHGKQYHDLLPVPYTAELVEHVASRAKQIQDILQTEVVIENVSAYISFCDSEMNEAEFLSEISKSSGCSLLLDINNIYVNCHNLNFKFEDYLKSISKGSIRQIHLAGHLQEDDVLIDNHGSAPNQRVLEQYQKFIQKIGPTPTCLEWDQNIPPYETINQELERIREFSECP